METGLTQQQILAETSRSPHGNYAVYLPVCGAAARQDPDFFAHLVSWNALKGEVKDARVAFPVIALMAPADREFVENALAHMAAHDPRHFLKALRFAREQHVSNQLLKRLVRRYLRDREAYVPTLERTMLQHRASMQTLYAQYRVKPLDYAKAVLFGPGRADDANDPRWRIATGTLFDVVRNLHAMAPMEAAGAMLKWKIPYLVAEGSLGPKLKSPEVVLALIKQMTPTELVNKTKLLNKLGVRKDPALRAAYEEALERAGQAKGRKATLKATKAAEVLEAEADGEDTKDILATKLRALQERQISQTLSVEGDWLVLGDKSASMASAIETACRVAEILARAAKGTVHLVFFNTSPQYFDCTGKTYEQIKALTRHVSASGNTSIGCGLDYALQRKLVVDGIAVVSDGGENREPWFASTYQQYAKAFDRTPPVYFYRTMGDPNRLTPNCAALNIALEEIPLGASVDYYSLPNLVSTMRINRYALMDEIRDTPLLMLNDVLKRTSGREVLKRDHDARTVEAG